jgi:hypothetical protein
VSADEFRERALVPVCREADEEFGVRRDRVGGGTELVKWDGHPWLRGAGSSATTVV